TRAIENLARMLQEVPGIGVVLIGEGDLSQELGHPREYEHPVVAEAIDRILKICKDHNVPCGHPHPDAKNIERLIASGYRFLMPSTPRSFRVLEQGRKIAGRTQSRSTRVLQSSARRARRSRARSPIRSIARKS